MAKKILSQGKNLNFNSSSNKAKIIKIFGESTQQTRKGTNLLPYPFFETTKTTNGITFTDNGDGTLTLNGTATADTYIILQTNAEYGDMPINGKADGTNGIYCVPITGEQIGMYYNPGNKILSLNVTSGATINNLLFKPQIALGTEVPEWEQYGQMPSPAFPSEIESVSGKNLAMYNEFTALKGYANTCDANSSGDGKKLWNIYISLPKDTQLVASWSFESDGTTVDNISNNRITIIYTDNTTVITQKGKPFTIDSSKTLASIMIYGNHNATSTIFSNFQIEKNIKPTFYVPYNHIGFKSVGKNLFDIDTFKALNSYNRYENYNGIECLRLLGNTITYNFDGKENTQYTFKLNIIGETGNDIGMWQFVYSDGTTSNILYIGNVTGIKAVTSTANKTIKGIKWNAWSSGHSVYIDKNSMQLEEGPATAYEPYREVITAIPFDGELRSLPDGTRDRLYTSDGKIYYEQNVEIMQVTSNLGWASYNDGNVDNENILQFSAYLANINHAGSSILSNHFTQLPSKDDATLGEGIFLHPTLKYVYIRINKSRLETANVEGLKKWFDEHEVKLQYKLAESITTEIGDEVALATFIGENNVECPSESVIVYEELEQILEEIRITNSGKLEPFGLTIDYNKTDLPLMAEAIEASQTVAGADGDIVFATTYGARLFEIVAVTDDFLTPEEKEAKREEVRLAIDKIKNKTTKLVIEPLNRTFVVKYNGLAEDVNMPKSVEFRIPLKSSSAYAISNERYSTTGEEYFASNTQKDVGATITIEGPATYPSFSLNGVDMKLNHILAEGAKLVIDTSKYTVTHINRIGTETNYMPYYNKGFPKIQNGANILFVNSGVKLNQIKTEWNDLLL